MSKQLQTKISNILLNGGIVIEKLKELINILEDIRHPHSIETLFKDSFKLHESTSGQITKSIKDKCFEHINLIWDRYPEGERKLYKH